MDPDENLTEQLRLAESILAAGDACNSDLLDIADDAERLAELVQALHGWLKKGGFLPSPWQPKPAGVDDDNPYKRADAAFAPLIEALSALGWNRPGMHKRDPGAGALEVLQTGGWVFCLSVPLSLDAEGDITRHVLISDPRYFDGFSCSISDPRTGEGEEEELSESTEDPRLFAERLTARLAALGYRPKGATS